MEVKQSYTFIVFGFQRIYIDDQGLTPTMELYPTFAIVLLVAVIKTNLDHVARGMQKILFLCHIINISLSDYGKINK